MTDPADPAVSTMPGVVELQRWTRIMGEAQQAMLEAGVELVGPVPTGAPWATMQGATPAATASAMFGATPGAISGGAVARWWRDGLALWGRVAAGEPAAVAESTAHLADKRFKGEAWREPWFDWIRRSYLAIADHFLAGADAFGDIEPERREAIRFATRALVDAMSPANFAFTNPEVIARARETNGESLLAGLRHLLADLGKGQLTHTDATAFEVGRNLAVTPGKVVKRTPLFELIQYTPTTRDVLATPLVIFPPWINRFYILDLTPEKSFIRWCVEQGITVFVVSWRSADASHRDMKWDDYVAAQVEAVDTARDLLAVPSVHAIGYCVAGTTLAATLALLAARGEAGRIASATFFTAQVDFSGAGDLRHFADDEQIARLSALAPDGYFDGRYMAATFNLLRGRDLIWNYVVSNYLMGDAHRPFDLLHWNGDTTNLPAAWHRSYLADLYRDNLLVQPGALSVDGTPIDLGLVATPAYVQAGREDHIAPPESVWRITEHFHGPLRFVLAGSGHIAGVVNPPAAGKYQHWVNDHPAATLADFIAGAREVKGSWWPDWLEWLEAHGGERVAATGARVPGEGALSALGEAPGEYVRAR